MNETTKVYRLVVGGLILHLEGDKSPTTSPARNAK
jgi:hypothetical protein